MKKKSKVSSHLPPPYGGVFRTPHPSSSFNSHNKLFIISQTSVHEIIRIVNLKEYHWFFAKNATFTDDPDAKKCRGRKPRRAKVFDRSGVNSESASGRLVNPSNHGRAKATHRFNTSKLAVQTRPLSPIVRQ